MKGVSYRTSLIGIFTSWGQFKKTRGVNIKSIKDKSNLCDLNIKLRFSLG